MANILTRDALLGWDGFKTAEVEMDRLGGTVLVRELNQAQREHMALRLQGEDGTADISKIGGLPAQLLCWAAIDEDGKPVFKATDVDRVNKTLPPDDLQKAARTIIELSGLIDKEPEEELPN